MEVGGANTAIADQVHVLWAGDVVAVEVLVKLTRTAKVADVVGDDPVG